MSGFFFLFLFSLKAVFCKIILWVQLEKMSESQLSKMSTQVEEQLYREDSSIWLTVGLDDF